MVDDSSDVNEAEFIAEWNIEGFTSGQYGPGLEDLKHILTVTGNCQDAQMTIIGRYIEQTWPHNSNYLIEHLQNCCKSIVSRAPKDGRITDTELTKEYVRIRALGSSKFLCVIGQQLAWLGAARRSDESGLCYSNTTWRHENPKDLASGSCRFTIDYEIKKFDDDEPKPCWHLLLGDFVVATGFPIPERRYDDRGLQIPVEVMAALMGVFVAVNTGSGFMLRDDRMSLIPVDYSHGRVQWHLAKNNESQQGMIQLGEDEIHKSIGFLGWTPEVVNYQGCKLVVLLSDISDGMQLG
ncbi:hypothetical protein GGR58DRAFT_501024 [Xylaria digitata]|nr:hypothetical protein GGR58DRAFT_501024 [Xylaria digitata]